MKELPLTEPLGIVQSAADLTSLLAAATAEHEAGQRAERVSLEHYRNAGLALIQAKAQAGHGQWLNALKRTGIPQQRASEYVRLAEGWEKLPLGGSFTLKGALQALSTETEPEVAREAQQRHLLPELEPKRPKGFFVNTADQLQELVQELSQVWAKSAKDRSVLFAAPRTTDYPDTPPHTNRTLPVSGTTYHLSSAIKLDYAPLEAVYMPMLLNLAPSWAECMQRFFDAARERPSVP
jgi:hypothetical protein